MFGFLSKWLQKKAPSAEREFQTPHGIFHQWNEGGAWYASIPYGEENLAFTAMNVDGQPYPEFVDQIPNILRQLPSFEATARKAIPQITARHELDSVDGKNRDTDFSLDFYYEESEDVDSDSDAVTVFFKNGQIVKWEQIDLNEDDDDSEVETTDTPAVDLKSTQDDQPSNPWGTAAPNDGNSPSPWSS